MLMETSFSFPDGITYVFNVLNFFICNTEVKLLFKMVAELSVKQQKGDCKMNFKEEFSFGEAIEHMKCGLKVQRKGWNGKRQYIQLADGISYRSPEGDIVNCEHEAIGNKAIAFVGTSGVQMGWLASQADMLAEDWVIVE